MGLFMCSLKKEEFTVQIWEILLIGVGLSMDAAAVSMTNGMAYCCKSRGRLLAMPLFFGLFQAIMPILGDLFGALVADATAQYSGVIVLIILGIIGVKMAYDGIQSARHPEAPAEKPPLTLRLILIQAVATSIDALAVGFGFSTARVDILPAALMIGATTFLLSLAAIVVGRFFGDRLGDKAQVLGGAILIIIAVKSVL